MHPEKTLKITFISNFFNHHQQELSDALALDSDYSFIETEQMPESRKQLGYRNDIKPDYVLTMENDEKIWHRTAQSDVVIAGTAPEKLVKKGVLAGKLVFRYSERPLKKGLQPLKYFPRLVKWQWQNPMAKPIYMLCASGYTAADYSRFFLFKNRTYKWGYFPKTKKYTDVDRLLNKKDKTEILWCGRYAGWKHPDDVIKVADRLKKSGYNFSIKFIGTGKMEKQLREMARQAGLGENICFTGPISPEKVRENMEKAGIYLFTSDRQEGWGAVLNEAMNSGCAVVASHLAGSVPFLVKNNENALVYRCGDVDMLYEKVRYLLDNHEKQKQLGKAAYKTIVDEWNAQIAAQRLITLAQHILAGEKYPDLYESGPCSKAEIIKENWFDYET